MPPEDDTTLADAAREEAELGAGFDAETVIKPVKVEKTEPPAPEPATAPAAREPKPEYVRLTKAELAELKDAAAKSASHDRQYATAWGKIGNLTTMVNELRAGGGPKLDLSSAAFAKLKDQFPELAEMTREAVQNAIAGLAPKGAEIDDGKLESKFAEHASKREIANLEDAYPDWRAIVGAVDITKTQPDGANPFRKWLATKDATYQARINGTESAVVIERAINLFRQETKTAAPQPNARDAARREQIAGAVQPRGDGGAPAPGNTAEAELEAGFNS